MSNPMQRIEDVILGNLIKNPALIDEVLNTLKPEDFYSDMHRQLYKQLLTMHNEQTLPQDMMLFLEKVKIHNLEKNFVEAAILEICAYSPDISKIILDYVKTLKDKKAKDKKLKVLALFQQRLTQGEIVDTEAILRELEAIDDEMPAEIVGYNELLSRTMENLDALQDSDKDISGISSGFSSLDQLTCGFQPGNLIIIAARPSTGKTLFALQIADYAAGIEKLPVAFFSLEMTAIELIKRTLSRCCQIDNTLMMKGKFSSENWKNIAEFIPLKSSQPLFINDKAGLAVNDIRAYCKRIQKAHGLKLIVVDYLSLISENEGENENIRIGNISSSLKKLAKDLGVPVICLSQLSRKCEEPGRIGKPLLLSDLRSSGQIEQDADLVIFLEKTNHEQFIDCVIAKQRNGKLGSIRLKANFQYMEFDEGTI